MTENNWVKEIKGIVAQGNIESAIELFLYNVSKREELKEFEQPILLLSSRYYKSRIEKIEGVLNVENQQVNRNKLARDLLELTGIIEKNHKKLFGDQKDYHKIPDAYDINKHGELIGIEGKDTLYEKIFSSAYFIYSSTSKIKMLMNFFGIDDSISEMNQIKNIYKELKKNSVIGGLESDKSYIKSKLDFSTIIFENRMTTYGGFITFYNNKVEPNLLLFGSLCHSSLWVEKNKRSIGEFYGGSYFPTFLQYLDKYNPNNTESNNTNDQREIENDLSLVLNFQMRKIQKMNFIAKRVWKGKIGTIKEGEKEVIVGTPIFMELE